MSNHPPIDPLHFCYWLRGYTEVTDAKLPTKHEWQIINDHLNAVFTKVTPTYPALSGLSPAHNIQVTTWPNRSSEAIC